MEAGSPVNRERTTSVNVMDRELRTYREVCFLLL